MEHESSSSDQEFPDERRWESLITKETFASLDVSDATRDALKEMSMKSGAMTLMTKVQAFTIPYTLGGGDLLATAETGTGVSLAKLVPAVELLTRARFTPQDGTGVILITTTRELCVQHHQMARELMKHHKFTCSVLMGGGDREAEAVALRKGANLVVATPVRLSYHLQSTRDFNYRNLKMLIIDEADRCIDCGFGNELNQIVNLVPKDRQTLMFTSTRSKAVQDLATLALKPEAFDCCCSSLN